MAINTITIEFQPCEPAPVNGYLVFYRPQGSEIDYREAGPFLSSPAQFEDDNDPDNTVYEGYMTGDCGGGKLGPAIPFVTEFDGISQSDGSESDGSDSGSVGPELYNGIISFECESAAFAITDIQFNGVSVTPVSGSLPMLSTDPPLEIFVTNPGLGGTLKVIFDTPDAGVIRLEGVDTSEQISCIDGIAPAFLELSLFDVENSGTVPFTVDVLCGVCP